MKSKPPSSSKPKKLASLRKKAEQKLHVKKGLPKEFSSRDKDFLIHELQTHQIKLEIQNEELRTAQQNLNASGGKYAGLYNFAPVGYFTFGRDGRILEVNMTGADLLGTDKRLLLNKPFSRFIDAADLKRFHEHRMETARSRARQNCEIRLRRKDGSFFYAELQSIAVDDTDGHVGSCRTAVSDITERKTVEQMHKESDERYRSLVELSPEAICVWQGGSIVYVNPSGLRLFGAKGRGEVLGKKILDIIHPDFQERAGQTMREIEAQGTPVSSRETKILRFDGQVVDVEITASAITIGGSPATQAVIKDISERKQTETALRNSEKLYRLMFESNPYPMWIYDIETLRFLSVNDAAVARYGYSKEEFLSMTIKDIHAAEDIAVLLDTVSKIGTGLYDSGNWRHKKKDGTIIDVEIISHTLEVEGKHARVVLAHDITERKKAETALQESKQAYQTLVENLPGAVYRVYAREHNRIQFFSKTASVIGLRDDKLSSGVVCGIEYLVLAEDKPKLIAEVQRAIDEKIPFTIEYRLKHNNGDIHFMLERGTPIYGPDGKILYIDGVIFDVTESRLAERLLIESEERQRAVFDNSPAAIFAKDLHGRFILFNRQAERWLDVRREEILGKTDYELFPTDAADRLVADDRKVIETRTSLETEEVVKYGGRTHTHLVIKFPLFDASGAPYAICGIATDITERKQAEQNVQEARDAALHERRRLETILNTIPSGVLVADGANGGITLQNEQARNIMGREIIQGTTEAERIQKYGMRKSDGSLFQPEELPYVRAFRTGENIRDVEMVLKRQDGRRVTVLVNAAPLRGEDGSIIGSVTAFNDITERQHAEQAIKEARDAALRERQRLETILDTIPSGVFVAEGLEPEITLQNRQALDIFGHDVTERLSLTERIGKHRLHHPDGRPFRPEELPGMMAIRNNETIRNVEVVVERPDGRWITALANAAPLRDETENIIGSVSVFYDISERKRVELEVKEGRDAAQRERSRLQTILNTIPLGVFVTDANEAITLQNEHAQAVLGRDMEQISAVAERIHIIGLRKPDGGPLPVEELPSIRSLRNGEIIRDVEIIIERPGERPTTLLVNSAPLRDEAGHIIGSISAFRDITERKHAEEALKRAHAELELRVHERTAELAEAIDALEIEVAERRQAEVTLRETTDLLETMFSNIHVAIAYLDQEFNYVRVNRIYAEGDGRAPEFFPGKNHFVLYPNEENEEIFRRVVTTGMPYFTYADPFEFPEHPERGASYWDWSLVPVKEPDGRVSGLILSLINVTERKLAETERARLAAAVEATVEAIVITDTRGFIQYVNPAFEQITGYTKQEALGNTLHILDSGKHGEEFYRQIRETIRRNGFWKGLLTNKRKDGTLYYEDCTYSPVKDQMGAVVNYVSIKHDVTDKLRLEYIAETATTMNNIGYVFSGIRHEIGNPVSSLLIILGIMKKKFDTSPKETLQDYIDQAIAQVERVEYLLTTLKNFNMYEALKIKNVLVTEFMEKFISLAIEDLEKKGIRFDISIAPEAGWMSADPRALQQALLNIVVNAADALAGRADPKIVMRVFKSRGMVQIRISDNGVGIPADKQKDLFKPFYTTKAHGTGLGLVITKKLLSRMNGIIEIASRKDEGTTVDIYIPEGTIEP
jgi:PAS domain S-box-containing protein